ncbi:MAG: transglutaminase domain-containing protein [Vulcanimicrobiota bacterium]
MRDFPLKTKVVLVLVCMYLFLFAPESVLAQQEAIKISNFINEDGLITGKLSCIKADPGDWIWVGAREFNNNDVGGFSIINANDHILTYNQNDGLASNAINDIEFDLRNNIIWFATPEGLSAWNMTDGTWQTYNDTNSGLKENNVTCIYMDSEGNKILGTMGGGLFQLNNSDDEIVSLKTPVNNITGIIIDSRENLWVSSHEGLAYRQDGVWVNFNSENSALVENRIEAIVEAPDKTIMGATQKGIVMFDGISWNIMDTSNSDLPIDQITDLFIDKHNTIWVSTWGGGLCRLDDKNRLIKTYSRKNSEILDNRINSVTMDNRGDIWACTARGVSQIHLMAAPADTYNLFGINRQGYEWNNKSENEDITLKAGLARNHYGEVVWDWCAFRTPEGFDLIEPAITLEEDVFGNRWLNIGGNFETAFFVQNFITKGTFERIKTRPYKAYPFPAEFDPTVKVYLTSSDLIPGNNQEIKELAESLIQNSSRGDMLLTANDILFSKYFANMPYKLSGKLQAKEAICKNPREDICRTPLEVVRDNAGISYSKNRLACSMLKSVGIPARLIDNGEHYLGEAYIEGKGWIPFDLTYPVYALNRGLGDRLQFPFELDDKRFGVIAISTSKDNIKTFVWEPKVKAVLYGGDNVIKEIKKIENFRQSNFLLVLPATEEILPVESRIPVADNVLLTVRKEENEYLLKFYDQNNKIFQKTPLEKFNKPTEVYVGSNVQIKFIPQKIGKYILFRIIEWEIMEE